VNDVNQFGTLVGMNSTTDIHSVKNKQQT
jgi:hypothetical protein